jgi:outer membrane protein OmpA-like peptidoglycan-associated protein
MVMRYRGRMGFRGATLLAAMLLAGCGLSHVEVELPPDVPVEAALPSTIRFVLFAPGSSRLDETGRAAVARFLADAARGRVGPAFGALPDDLPPFAGTVEVTGFADPAEVRGSARAARRLGLARAQAVAALLAAGGIAAGRLAVEAGDPAILLIPAPSGAAEPANRRVEIRPVDES